MVTYSEIKSHHPFLYFHFLIKAILFLKLHFLNYVPEIKKKICKFLLLRVHYFVSINLLCRYLESVLMFQR